MTRRARRRAVSAVAAAITVAAVGVGRLHATAGAYTVSPLVSDARTVPAPRHDRALVNAWGLAASPTGPWWTANEASGTSTLYSGAGRKQLLTVQVEGGPTGIAYYGGRALLVRGGGRSDPARFVFACEDGKLRAWTPTVPTPWSASAEITVDDAGLAAVFRGVAIAGDRVFATDFHGDRVVVFDGAWRQVATGERFTDPSVPASYGPAGIQIFGGRVFVTYIGRAPVDGNDAPTGGYVDEFGLDGRLLARVSRVGELNEPWGLALAPGSFGRYGGDLLVASFGDGTIRAYRTVRGGWRSDGVLRTAGGKPVVVPGVWGIAFGNGGLAGPAGTLFAAAGPHRWHGASEVAVHGLLAAVAAAG